MVKAKDIKRLPSGKLEYRGEQFEGFNKPKRNTSGNLTKDDKFSANYWARKKLWAGAGGSVSRPKPGGPRKG